MPPTLPRRKLPVGIQSFAKLREKGFFYVDRTPHALQLIDSGSYWRIPGQMELTLKYPNLEVQSSL
jgi:hypothetical protein